MKNHIFFDIHNLSVKGADPKKLYFQAEPNIAYAWQKAQNGMLNDAEKEWFKQLRDHELTEMQYMAEGMPLVDQSTWLKDLDRQGIDPSKNAHDKANLTAKAPGDFPGYEDIGFKEWLNNCDKDKNDY